MTHPSHVSFTYEEQLEDVPSEFEESRPSFSEQYSSTKFPSHIQITKPHPNQLIANKKLQAKHFLHKNEQFQVYKQQKIQTLKTEQEQRVQKTCTFHPLVNRSRSKSARNVQQFLDSQQKHLERIEEKKQILKERIDMQNRKNMTFSPRINPSHHHRNKENVHQRLYKLKDKEDRDAPYRESFTHVPKITEKGEKLVRTIPVNQLLYLDAKRRADKQSHVQPEGEDRPAQRNYTQQKYAAQKFLKDFKHALVATNLAQRTEYNEEQLFNLLQELGYARYSHAQHSPLALEEKKLLKDCYNFLEQHGVTQINIYVFLLAISGIYGIDLNNDQINGVLVIEQDDGRKLHHYFDLLFRNRLFTDVSKKQRPLPREQNSFKPTINPDSQQMAQKYRNKMIHKANDIFSKNNIDIQLPQAGLSHEDLLVICSLGQNLQKEKLRQLKSHQKDPECTFQPNSAKYPQEFISSQMGEDKCKELYENAKVRQDEVEKLATFRSFENTTRNLQSGRKESVSPNPKNSSVSKSNIKSYLEIKDVDKTLARMVTGRQQRNEKRQLQERGQKPSKAKHLSHHKTNSDNEWPSRPKQLLLDADIMVNNAKKKIYIYKEDENRIDEVVEEFARQCDLDLYSKNMLYERLMDAIRSLKAAQLQNDY